MYDESEKTWIRKFDDGDDETVYEWTRVGLDASSIAIRWLIGSDAKSGTYRLKHSGDYKFGWTGRLYNYQGSSSSFRVINPNDQPLFVVPGVTSQAKKHSSELSNELREEFNQTKESSISKAILKQGIYNSRL